MGVSARACVGGWRAWEITAWPWFSGVFMCARGVVVWEGGGEGALRGASFCP